MNLQALDTLHMHKKTTAVRDRYDFFADDGEGSAGQPIAFAEQQRPTLPEQVTVHTSAEQPEPLGAFHARGAIGAGGGYEMTDGAHNPIGGFRKDVGKSLLNSTWHLESPGAPTLTGRERSKPVAILRRIWCLIPETLMFPFPVRYHFDFVSENGTATAFSVTTESRGRGHYRIDITDSTLDRRPIILQTIAIDALQPH